MSIFHCVQFLKMTLYTEIFTCIIHIYFFNARILTKKFDYYYLFFAWSKALTIYILLLLPKIDFLKILQHKKKSNSNENHQVVWKKKILSQKWVTHLQSLTNERWSPTVWWVAFDAAKPRRRSKVHHKNSVRNSVLREIFVSWNLCHIHTYVLTYR